MVFTSTTAPGKVFESRSELADHYKSDWHKYNLKRREAGLGLLEEEEFQSRLKAALSLRQEKEKKNNTDHIKDKNQKKRDKKKKRQQHASAVGVKKNNNNNCDTAASRNSMCVDVENGDVTQQQDQDQKHVSRLPQSLIESQENPEIDPKLSLFDQHRSDSLTTNVEYMQSKYGFFLPDQECLVDLEGLLGYFHEKIKLGHYCLYCEKIFPTWQGCQQHMINKEHCKVRFEEGFWDELDPFYDFHKANEEFLGDGNLSDESVMEVDDGDDGGLEDMSVDENNQDDGHDDSEEILTGFEKEIARFGLNVTDLGELIFPDGRVVGHRALRRYYRQRLRPTSSSKPSVVAAQKASGERLFQGRVVDIRQHKLKPQDANVGKGILVAIGSRGDGRGTAAFSALSLYRYRAAVRKQREGDERGRRLKNKTFQNMNKMDKKHNRLMNGVSVAHAKR